jgi:hypothetical protein
MPRTAKNDMMVVSTLRARANFGQFLRWVEDERRLVVIGMPKAILLSIRDYVRLATPGPEALRIIGEESHRKGTDGLTPRQIDQVIKTARSKKPRL